jgi:hypothetical protein
MSGALFAGAVYLLAVVLAWPGRNPTAAEWVLAGYLVLLVLIQLAEHLTREPHGWRPTRRGRWPRTGGSRSPPGCEAP